MTASEKTIASTLLLIGSVALALWVLGDFQTNDTDQIATSTDARNESNELARELSSNQLQTAKERIIYRGDPPYLSELPILDGNLFATL